MSSKISILLAITAAATSSFLQTPSNQLESTFNSTFLSRNERLFKPIIIPNVTKSFDLPEKTKADENILKNILRVKDSSEESIEESRTTVNPLKFSSRYSTKQNNLLKERTAEKNEIEIGKLPGSTEIPDSTERNENEVESTKNEKIPNLFLGRSDILDYGEENRKNIQEYSESSEESEESEVRPTSESPEPTSFKNYLDKESENYETTSATEETDSSEERKGDETEDKRSVEDYFNSGSKNYHSIQTPLNRIKYQRANSFSDDYDSENDRKRIVSPIVRLPISHNWPYSKSQIKAELENLNEISESDESYEKESDGRINEKPKTNPKQLRLESAEEKDNTKFDRSKKYNYVELRDRKKKQQKGLIAEEEKDDQKPLFQSLKQYEVDEEESTQQPKANSPILSFKNNNKVWSTKHPSTTTPGHIFQTSAPFKRLKIQATTNKQTANFQDHQFLGPVVFNQNFNNPKSKPFLKPQKEVAHNIFLKDLIENEKLDQDHLANQRLQKSLIQTESKTTQSFDHLKESDEMYNAILANIQSVFGLRTQPLKSGTTRSRKGPVPEVNLDESKALTWSLPLIKD